MSLRTLHLYGDLADRYGAQHEVCAPTISEAIRIVDCNHPGFSLNLRRRQFHVGIGDGDDVQELPQHHLFVPRSRGDWHLIPAAAGGKSRTMKTVFSIVVGGALLATGIGGALGAAQGTLSGTGATISLGTQAGFAASTGFLGLSYGTVALMGAGVFLGGLNQLLTPTPKMDTGSKKPTSFSFDGPGEVDDEGGPIHLILGEVITGGVRIASAVESTVSGSITAFDNTKKGMMAAFAHKTVAQINAFND